MAADKHVEVLRFANRVPLMYQQGGCLLTKAIESVDWRRYGLDKLVERAYPKDLLQFLFTLQARMYNLPLRQKKPYQITSLYLKKLEGDARDG